jgi:hypothetical protein
MTQSTNHRSGARRAAAGVVAIGVAAACALAGSASAPASSEASRLVTITFNDSGKGRWSTSGDTDRGSMAMNYSWKGTAKFRVPTTALKNPSKAKFSVRGTGSLSGNWVGDFAGTQFGTASAGPYHCTYKGALVKTTVDAQFRNGPKKGKLQILLFARSYETGIYFFPTKGAGVTQDCANATGAGGPAHFSPAALFRDSFNVGGQLTTQTAIIDVPSTLLPRGNVKVTFPREVGNVDSPLRPKLAWRNVGTLSLKAR